MGMELTLTRKGNVYGETLPEGRYRKPLQEATEEEYQSALVSAVIRREPSSVREIALLTGLPVYTVSLRVGELERQRQAEIRSYRGTTPVFVFAAHEGPP